MEGQGLPAMAHHAVWETYKRCKHSPSIISSIAVDIGSLYVSFKHLVESKATGDRSCNETEYFRLNGEIDSLVKEIGWLADKLERIGSEASRSFTALQKAVGEVGQIREKILRATRSVETVTNDRQTAHYQDLEEHLDRFVAEIYAGSRQSNAARRIAAGGAAQESEEAELWKELKSELMQAGISEYNLLVHEGFIKHWFRKTDISNELPGPGGEASSSQNNPFRHEAKPTRAQQKAPAVPIIAPPAFQPLPDNSIPQYAPAATASVSSLGSQQTGPSRLSYDHGIGSSLHPSDGLPEYTRVDPIAKKKSTSSFHGSHQTQASSSSSSHVHTSSLSKFSRLFGNPEEKLIKAVNNNDVKLAESIIEQKAFDIDTVTCGVQGNSILMHAFSIKKEKVAYLLIKYCNLNFRNIHGRTPLLAAIWFDASIEIIGALLAAGANPNLACLKASPLSEALAKGRDDILDLLTQYGANPNSVVDSTTGTSHLHLAVSKADNPDMLHRFLSLGCDVNVRDSFGNTPLLLAVGAGNIAIVRDLISAGASLHARNVEGFTALHIAAQGPLAHEFTDAITHQSRNEDLWLRIIPVLVNAGAHINAADRKGRTPLHWAAKYWKAETIKTLLALGADHRLRDNKVKTPLNLVQKSLKEVNVHRRHLWSNRDESLQLLWNAET